MKIFKLIRKIKNSLVKKEILVQSEEEYYENLFVKNSKWNTPNPNDEELLRWEVIQNFVKIAKNEQISDEEYTILDLGCGRGWLTNLLLQYGNVKGIEPVRTVIEYAKKLYPMIDFESGNAKDLIKDGSVKFDLIVSSEVIEHVPDEEKSEFIADIYCLLKDGGFLILSTPRDEVQKEWNKYMGANQPIEDWISEDKLEKILNKNSFKTVQLERIKIRPIEKASEIDLYQVWLFKKI